MPYLHVQTPCSRVQSVADSESNAGSGCQVQLGLQRTATCECAQLCQGDKKAMTLCYLTYITQ